MRYWLFCIFMGFAVVSVQAHIINIPADYSTIQAGIDASINGDTVFIAPGDYVQNGIVQDKNILISSTEGPNTTHIFGKFYFFGSDIDSTCILRGLNINGVNVSGFPDNLVRIDNGAPLIIGNILENNSNNYYGAGVLAFESSPIVRGNIIRNNWSCAYGGGLAVVNNDTTDDRFVIIEGNIISGNRAGNCIGDLGDAGGVFVNRGIVRYNLIINNYASRVALHSAYGGGLGSFNFHSKIYNNTIIGNSAGGGSPSGHGVGGGMYISIIQPEEDDIIKNNIIAFNPLGGGAYSNINDSTGIIWNYNVLFDNDTTNYLGFQPGPYDIQVDPLFTDTSSQNYGLLRDSPCIDAGDPSFPLDPDSTRCDIGAYYFDQTVSIDGDGSTTGSYKFSLNQNYPNPFNSQTVITYSLNSQAIVSLNVYSITGHRVSSIINGEKQKEGEYKYIWKGRNDNGMKISTGIYFYELYVGAYKESKAMIVIK